MTATFAAATVTAFERRPCPGLVRIPGRYRMGSDSGRYPEEAPAHTVQVDGFWIDAERR